MKLIIDTTEKYKIITALARGEKIFTEKERVDFFESEKLLMTVDRLFTKYNIKPKDLKAILVVTGPGPFTSLRIGLAVANTLAYSLNIPVFGFKKNEFKSLRDLVVKSRKRKKTKIAYPHYGQKPNITKPKKKWLK